MAGTLWLMASVLGGLGPADARPGAGTAVGGWARADLAGYTLALVDDRQVRQYSFHEKGHVAATVGQRGGFVCGPVFYWHLDRDGVLVITEDEDGGRVVDRLKKVRLGPDRAEVERAGRRETYTRTKR